MKKITTLAITLTLLLTPVAATAFVGWVTLGLSVVSSLAGSAASRKRAGAARLSAEARAAEFEALQQRVLSLASDIEANRILIEQNGEKIDSLPEDIELIRRSLELEAISGNTIRWADQLLAARNSPPESVEVRALLDRINANITDVENAIPYFAEQAEQGNAVAISQLALLLEVGSVGYHSMAVYAITQSEFAESATDIEEAFECPENLPRELIESAECNFSVVMELADDAGVVSYRALSDLMASTATTWSLLEERSVSEFRSLAPHEHIIDYSTSGTDPYEVTEFSREYEPRNQFQAALLGIHSPTTEQLVSDFSIFLELLDHPTDNMLVGAGSVRQFPFMTENAETISRTIANQMVCHFVVYLTGEDENLEIFQVQSRAYVTDIELELLYRSDNKGLVIRESIEVDPNDTTGLSQFRTSGYDLGGWSVETLQDAFEDTSGLYFHNRNCLEDGGNNIFIEWVVGQDPPRRNWDAPASRYRSYDQEITNFFIGRTTSGSVETDIEILNTLAWSQNVEASVNMAEYISTYLPRN